ncbi:MAG: tandem-95 repeat protein, partial [Mycobacteriaceae bacterium]|nr:tandem-95 repeat protein [Mycobacteriaceae bacterium]
TFTYRLFDGRALSAPTTVTITVNSTVPVNHVPTAQDVSVSMSEDGGLSWAVSTSTTDVDGDLLTASVVGQPTHGTVEFVDEVNYLYRPTANFTGTDTFTYRLYDGTAYSNTATVTITVNPVNDVPVAVNDTAGTNEDTAVTIDVLANDLDADGDALTTTVVTDPAHGTVVHNADGSFTYTPAANFNGTDTFTYKVSDATTTSTAATVNVTVVPVNDVVVASDRSVSMSEDGALSSVVALSATDVDGDPLTASVVGQPTHGTVEFVDALNYLYRPTENFTGTDTFTYRLYDGTAYSNTATVTITVNPVNDTPIAVNDSYTTAEDTPLNVAGPGVRANDGDVDGVIVAATVVDSVDNGTLTLNNDGSFNYTTNANFNGTDTFTYTVTDNQGGVSTTPATVTITVGPVNDVPVAGNDSATTNEDTAVTINVLANDSDIDGNSLTTAVVADPAHGTVVHNADGSFTYTPAADYTGPDSFTYRVYDGTTNSNTATVSITVNAVNTPGVVASEDLAGVLGSVRYSADGSRALVVTDVLTSGAGTSHTVVLVDTATDTAITAPLTIIGDIVNIELGDLRGGIISTSTSDPATTTLTTIDMADGQLVNTQTVNGHFLSVQYPHEATAVLSTVVRSQVTGLDTVTVRFIDTYSGALKGDDLTFVGNETVVTFGQLGRTVITFTTRPDSIAHVAVFDYFDGQQRGHTINLTGTFSQPDTLSQNTFLFEHSQTGHSTAVIVTTSTGTNPSNAKTILTTIDLDTIDQNQAAAVTSTQIDGRVHSLQADPNRDRAYLITEIHASSEDVIATVLTVLNTTTGGTVAPSLTYTGEINTLILNPDHTRALLTYTDTTGATHAAIIDTATATQTGQILNLTGGFTDTILLTDDSTRAAILTTLTPTKGTPTTTITTINLGTGTIASSLGLAGTLDSVRYNADGSRALVVTDVLISGVGTGHTVVLVDTATDTAIGAPLTIIGDIVNIELGDLRGGIISTSTSDPATTTLTTIDMADGQLVNTQTVNGHFLSVQYPHEATAVLSTVVRSQVTGLDTVTVRFIDTYSGALKGDDLTFVGNETVVTFGQLGRTVITFTTRPDSIAHVAVFDYFDGQQRGHTVDLTGTFSQPDTLSQNTFLFEHSQSSPAIAVIVTTSTGTSNTPTKTILTVIDLDTGTLLTSEQIDGRVHSLQADPDRDRAYLITEIRAGSEDVVATVLTVFNTATGHAATPLTYTGAIDNLTLNPDHTRALLTYTDTTGATHAAIIDTDTGIQTGPTLDLPGGFTDTILLTDDSTHAAILTTLTPTKGTPTTTITTINLGHDLIV